MNADRERGSLFFSELLTEVAELQTGGKHYPTCLESHYNNQTPGFSEAFK